jgi:hypothetical protein
VKNPFKKKQKVEPVKEAPKPTVIQTVLGYELDGTIYKSVEAAKAVYVSHKLRELCTYPKLSSNIYMPLGYDGKFVNSEAEDNYAAIKSLINEELPVVPLAKVEPITGTGYTVPQWYTWDYNPRCCCCDKAKKK